MKKLLFALILLPAISFAQERPAAPIFVVPASATAVELFTTTGTVLQVLTPNLHAGEAFHVQGTHDGQNVASFSLVFDGAVLETKPVSAMVAGVIDFFRPAGTTAGTHTIVLRATGTGSPALVTNSSTLTIVVDPPTAPAPAAFTNVRIIR